MRLISSAALGADLDKAKEFAGNALEAAAYVAFGLFTATGVGCGDDSESEDKVDKEVGCTDANRGAPLQPKFTTLEALAPVRGIVMKTSDFIEADKSGAFSAHISRCAEQTQNDNDFLDCTSQLSEYTGVEVDQSKVTYMTLDEGDELSVPNEHSLTFIAGDGASSDLFTLKTADQKKAFCADSDPGEEMCTENDYFKLSCDYAQ